MNGHVNIELPAVQSSASTPVPPQTKPSLTTTPEVELSVTRCAEIVAEEQVRGADAPDLSADH